MTREKIISLFNKAALLTVDDEVESWNWEITENGIVIDFLPTDGLFQGIPYPEGGVLPLHFELLETGKIENNQLILLPLNGGVDQYKITFYRMMNI